MPRKPKPKPDNPTQSKRFTDMAREIGADASEEKFERAFKKVMRFKEPSPKPSGRRSRRSVKRAES